MSKKIIEKIKKTNLDESEEAVGSVVQLTPVCDSEGNYIRHQEGILCQVIENGVESLRFFHDNFVEEAIDKAKVSENQQEPERKLEWGDNDTRLLLDLYSAGLSNVGPLKKHRKKKDLWEYIGQEIEKKLGLKRTGSQCQTRYKTILKRKGEQDKQNKTSGQIRCPVSFENEIKKIKAIDDSLEPEVMLSSNKLEITNKKRDEEKPSTSQMTALPPAKKKRVDKQDLLTFFERLYKEKEENKERRHQKKMTIIKEALQKNPESN